VDVPLPQAVFGAIFEEALAGIHQEYRLPDGGIEFVDHHNANLDARASVRVLPCQIVAVGLPCKIMFIRARPLVAASFSWP
jgi:hypothetical protein